MTAWWPEPSPMTAEGCSCPPARRAPTTSRRASRLREFPRTLAVFHGPRRIARYSAQIAAVPTAKKRDTVLAAVKDAARRLRRWPMTLYPVTI
jgi:hypothetical protein